MKKIFLVVIFIILFLTFDVEEKNYSEQKKEDKLAEIYIAADFSKLCECSGICDCIDHYEKSNVLNKTYYVPFDVSLYSFFSSILSGYASIDNYKEIYPSNKTRYNITYVYKININTASYEELDGIDGFGEITCNKIINSRSNLFTSTYDLVKRDIIGETLYENIKDIIVV